MKAGQALDEMVDLAGRRALLGAEIERIDTRIAELREVLTGGGQSALPPDRPSSKPRKRAGATGKKTLRDKVMELLSDSGEEWTPEEVASVIRGADRRQAAQALHQMYTAGKIKRPRRGEYQA